MVKVHPEKFRVSVYTDGHFFYFYESSFTSGSEGFLAPSVVQLAQSMRVEGLDLKQVVVLKNNRTAVSFFSWLAGLLEEALGISVLPMLDSGSADERCNCPQCQAHFASMMRGVGNGVVQ